MLLHNYIEHTLLSPTASEADVKRLCKEALKYQFKAVCIPPYYAAFAKDVLATSDVILVTTVGFPNGNNATSAKVEEAKRALSNGAVELDMVVNLSAVKNKDWGYVRNDIQSLVNISHMSGAKLKVIIEVGLLTKKEVVSLCEICVEAEADFVKTATGVLSRGATEEDVVLLKKHLPPRTGIKASGGIATKKAALALIKAGANRLGTSKGLNLV